LINDNKYESTKVRKYESRNGSCRGDVPHFRTQPRGRRFRTGGLLGVSIGVHRPGAATTSTCCWGVPFLSTLRVERVSYDPLRDAAPACGGERCPRSRPRGDVLAPFTQTELDAVAAGRGGVEPAAGRAPEVLARGEAALPAALQRLPRRGGRRQRPRRRTRQVPLRPGSPRCGRRGALLRRLPVRDHPRRPRPDARLRLPDPVDLDRWAMVHYMRQLGAQAGIAVPPDAPIAPTDAHARGAPAGHGARPPAASDPTHPASGRALRSSNVDSLLKPIAHIRKMAHDLRIPDAIPFRTLPKPLAAAVKIGIAVLLLIGVAAWHPRSCLVASRTGSGRRFLFNWLFWSSLAIGMVMFAVALHLTEADWAWSIRRLRTRRRGLPPGLVRPADRRLLRVGALLPPLAATREYFDPVIEAKRAWLTCPS
jgi:hypothetical protein